MALITITSDLGIRDYYVAALKGAIINNSGFVNIVDITHSIKPFDIKEAAYTVKNAFRYFPNGTIHVIHVNSTDGKDKLLLAVVDGHYFLTFDNGFLSLAFEKMPHQTYEVNPELLENSSLMYEDAIGKVVNLLVKEFQPTDFAHLTTETINFRLMQPITSPGSIRGTIINIDNFGNAVSNITRPMFDQFIGDRRFSILTNVGSTKEISKRYNDVDEGDIVCLFNTSGYLEVAINKGKAENLLGLKLDMPVMVLAD
jgi:S-adenosyl-L-methionine hydrolase (adenosine-forming)